MGDIFERIKRQYDAWKLEQKYMRRRPASRLMGTHTQPPFGSTLHFAVGGAARFDPCHAAGSCCVYAYVWILIFWVGSSYRYDNGEYVPSLSSPPSPAPSNTSNSFSLKNRKSWIGR